MKRLFDIVVSACALLVLALPLLVVMWMVRRKLGSPVFFTQVRPGLHGKPFKMVKFRSMTNERGPDGELLPDAVRLTSFGRLLRSTSLDELPELWNVLKGEMSLVGPRPLLMEYLEYYSDEEMLRHSVRPGITGLAQISGRNALSWEQKLALDVEYVRKSNFLFDIKIIFLTFIKVVRREDVLESAPQGSFSSYRNSKNSKVGK